MSITTYSELQTALSNWLHRSDLTALIPDFIVLGEKRIMRKARVRVMETALSGTIASGVIAVPTDYLGLKFAYINSSPTRFLTRASASQIYTDYPNRSATDKPSMIGREGANFIFGPYPDSGYSVSGIYYARPTSIVSSANAFFLLNPDVYLFAALCEAAPYMGNDTRVALWESKMKTLLDDLDAESDDEYSSGGGLAVRAA